MKLLPQYTESTTIEILKIVSLVTFDIIICQQLIDVEHQIINAINKGFPIANLLEEESYLLSICNGGIKDLNKEIESFLKHR